MRGRKSALHVVLTPEEHDQLLKSLRCPSTSLGLARRCRAILEVAEGTPVVAVARLVGLTEKHVRKWVQRFLQSRLAGLHDRPGRGRKPVFSPRGGDIRGEDRLRTAR
ncbi:MAG: helix-turn-helix domain-containing protein [Verrucomicrobia bacterium]|jgi:Helix-turn-helix domain|nr:helix-turn-helix domain-containing protein [Verrucomicrobiota bacterium]